MLIFIWPYNINIIFVQLMIFHIHNSFQTKFRKWCPREPNERGGQENCIEYKNRCWNDQGCSTGRKFVCQKPPSISLFFIRNFILFPFLNTCSVVVEFIYALIKCCLVTCWIIVSYRFIIFHQVIFVYCV